MSSVQERANEVKHIGANNPADTHEEAPQKPIDDFLQHVYYLPTVCQRDARLYCRCCEARQSVDEQRDRQCYALPWQGKLRSQQHGHCR